MKEEKMLLIMKHTVCFNLAWQWRYLTHNTGFLFIGTHCTVIDSIFTVFWYIMWQGRVNFPEYSTFFWSSIFFPSFFLPCFIYFFYILNDFTVLDFWHHYVTGKSLFPFSALLLSCISPLFFFFHSFFYSFFPFFLYVFLSLLPSPPPRSWT